MANSKYSQVAGLVSSGQLRWQSDQILGCLVTGASFDAADRTLSQVGPAISIAPIQGRFMAEAGACMGLPVFFQKIPPDVEYQLVVVQNLNNGDPNVLAWYDTSESGPLKVENGGTLVVRPTLAEELPETYTGPESARMWMRV
jgi:hypothetical protein